MKIVTEATGHGVSVASQPEPSQQRTTHQGRCTERRHVGVATVVRRPTHVDDQHVDTGRTQPVDSISGKGMPMDIAADHEYRFVGLKGRQRSIAQGKSHVR